ncbi:MAG: cyclic nucleotide-binding domain-containing protein [Gallionella sp.]|nr:cyclic nucleotide-binding domain-containing protein [Gallionella sp.]
MTTSTGLVGDAKIMLPLFGNGLTVADVAEKLPPSVRACCVATVRNLLAEGYIVAGGESEVAAPSVESSQSVSPPPASPPASPLAVTVVEDDGLDFTGKFHTPDTVAPDPEEEQTLRLISKEKLAAEIEARAHQLALDKFHQFEIEMNNGLATMAEADSLRQEREALEVQHKMVESARLSPLFECLRASAFFADFPDAELAEVLHIGVWHEQDEQAVLINDGDIADSFFVMLKGLAGVFKRERLIGLIQPGDSFGEFSFLSGEGKVHHAGVVTRSHIEYMEFDNNQLKDISLPAQLRFASAFSRCQTKRLILANEQIVNLLTSES